MAADKKMVRQEIINKMPDGQSVREVRDVPVDERDHTGLAPLHHMIMNERLDGVTYLLEKGADANFPTETGLTPLHMAISQKNPSIVKALLAAKADGRVPSLGVLPVHLATILGNGEVLTLLLDNFKDQIDVRSEDRGESHALHFAALQDDVETLSVLYRYKPALNAQTSLGETPLYLAIAHHKTAAALSLLKAGADPNIAIPTGVTPLHVAAQEALVEVVKALVRAGAKSTVVMIENMAISPEMLAKETGDPEVLKALRVR